MDMQHIIGKGGMLIRELQELTKTTKIDVQQEFEMTQKISQGIYGRTLTLRGSLQARNHAVYLLLRQVRT